MSILPKQFQKSVSKDGSWTVLPADNIETVVALGIQAPPNTQFSINDDDTSSIYIGATGIYELNLQQGLGTITYLKITNTSNEENASILVDVLYESSTTGGELK